MTMQTYHTHCQMGRLRICETNSYGVSKPKEMLTKSFSQRMDRTIDSSFQIESSVHIHTIYPKSTHLTAWKKMNITLLSHLNLDLLILSRLLPTCSGSFSCPTEHLFRYLTVYTGYLQNWVILNLQMVQSHQNQRLTQDSVCGLIFPETVQEPTLPGRQNQGRLLDT